MSVGESTSKRASPETTACLDALCAVAADAEAATAGATDRDTAAVTAPARTKPEVTAAVAARRRARLEGRVGIKQLLRGGTGYWSTQD
jgi:hypothetical protein